MKKYELKNMIGGWFVGDFTPSLLQNNNFEVAIKKYEAGDYEKKHYHKQAVEFTVILNGKVKMNGVEYGDGDIIEIETNEATDFEALTNVTTVVVKTPSVKNDKFLL
jgi:anti-sigma factor ChrR (cupin superfamily)